MATKLATQVVERESAILSPTMEIPIIGEYLGDEGTSTAAPTPAQERAGLLERTVAALGKFFLRFSVSGLLLSLAPGFRCHRGLSYREKTQLEAFWKYGMFV